MKVNDIVKFINTFASEKYAYSWDNSALQIGDRNARVNKILLSLDVTNEVIDEAVENNADMIIAHHPFFFDDFKNIDMTSGKGKMIEKLIKNNISVYCAHTSLDVSLSKGLNIYMAEKLGLENIRPIEKIKQGIYKFNVMVPVDYAEKVREAISAAGAGHIGAYSDCTFTTQGEGQFRPLDGSDAFIGSVNELTKVKEAKIEAVVSSDNISSVINAVKNVHPYEEPAYDVALLYNKELKAGLGAVGSFKKERSFAEFIKLVKDVYNTDVLEVSSNYKEFDNIQKVGLCTGNGSSMLSDVIKLGIKVFITSDTKYHEFQDFADAGILLIKVGHYNAEICFTALMSDCLKEEFENIEIIVSKQSNIQVFI